MTAGSSKPARICFPFVGDRIGGSHVSTLTLIDTLDRHRFEPVIVLHQDGPLAELLRDRGLDYELVPLPGFVGTGKGTLQHILAIVRSLPTLRSFLRRRRIALLHGNDTRINLTWSVPAKLAGVPFVWHQRALFGDSRLSALMVRLSASVIAISRFIEAGLPQPARAKSSVIDNPFAAPPALERQACHRALCDELGVPPDTLIIGLFCNLIAWKRPLQFVDVAIALDRQQTPDFVFVAFGDDRHGLGAQMRERAAQAGLGDRLFLMGFRNPVWPWIAACDLLLATAENEPFGRTLVEAMLVGTPVVATASGGHLEIIDGPDQGSLVASDDVAAMATEAERLLRDEAARRSLAEHARKAATRRYDRQAHARSVESLYCAALGIA